MSVNKKCKYCGEDILKTDAVKKLKNTTYHVKCYKDFIREKYEKNTEEMDEKQELYDYINELYGTKELNPKIMAQVDKYHLEYELTYTKMFLVLKYFYDIMDNKVNSEYGIGIIPHVYMDAQRFWVGKNTGIDSNKNKDVAHSVSQRLVVKPLQKKEEVYLIDIDSL